jgi:hypothetical protein
MSGLNLFFPVALRRKPRQTYGIEKLDVRRRSDDGLERPEITDVSSGRFDHVERIDRSRRAIEPHRVRYVVPVFEPAGTL